VPPFATKRAFEAAGDKCRGDQRNRRRRPVCADGCCSFRFDSPLSLPFRELLQIAGVFDLADTCQHCRFTLKRTEFDLRGVWLAATVAAWRLAGNRSAVVG